ncbi:putative membrane protein, partial [Acinetobacter baumannii 45002_8]
MNVKVNSFNSFAFVSMAALAISGGSLVACQ